MVALVEEVLILTDKDLSKHRIQIEKKYHGRPKAHVVRGQIEQMLLNLIINARQAMPRGGRLVIEVRENGRTQMVELSLCDTGVGIPPERLRLIFEPFYTTKEPDEHGHGGSGPRSERLPADHRAAPGPHPRREPGRQRLDVHRQAADARRRCEGLIWT